MQMRIMMTVLQQFRACGRGVLHAIRSLGARRLQIGVTVGVIGLCLGYVLVGQALFAASSATLRYVAPGGSDSGDCARSDVPCATPQYAVDVASSGDEIRVAAGTYTGVQARAGMTQTLYLSKTLTLRGGYTSTNWSIPDPVANPTTLDAVRQGRVVYITGAISPTLTGLRLVNGDATIFSRYLYDNANAQGGGIYSITATVTLDGNWIMQNRAYMGGGVYVRSADARLNNNTVTSNAAGQAGGGLYLYATTVTLTDNRIVGNGATLSDCSTEAPCPVASHGGGLFVGGELVTLTGNTIAGNDADLLGGGGAIGATTITMTNNTITNNRVTYSGGGLALFSIHGRVMSNTITSNLAGSGGGVALRNYDTATDTVFKGNTIADNQAASGGGITINFGNQTLDGNLIVRNHAARGGGILIASHSSSTLSNTVIADNTASRGSGVYVVGGTAHFVHTTIARNRDSGGSGGEGVYVADYSPQSSVALTNTVVVSHTLGLVAEPGTRATLNGLLWFGNRANTSGTGTIVGTGETTGDPAFAADGYHLTFRSAARGRGTPAHVRSDIDGDLRPADGAVDLGADQLMCPTCSTAYLPLLFGP